MEDFPGFLSTGDRLMALVESEGTLSDHEQAIQREFEQAKAKYGHAAIMSISMSTTTVEGNVVRYSSALLIQVGHP